MNLSAERFGLEVMSDERESRHSDRKQKIQTHVRLDFALSHCQDRVVHRRD